MTSGSIRMMARAMTAVAAVLATPAFAQAGGQAAATAASNADIIVTARRTEERLQDVPISITVFNPEQLAARNIVNSTDLATYTPSLAVNGRYGPDKSSFAIRGFSQDLNTQPTVSVYFADVVAPRLLSNITSGNGAGVGSIFDLQNIQVLKGPQGTLFGRNTTGGAVLLVPQRPTDQLGGYVEGTYGNHDDKRIQAVLNLPLADTFKVRLGVDRDKRDGYIRNLSGIGPNRFNDRNYFAARLGVLAELTPDLENYLLATYSRSTTNGTLGKAAFCNPASTAIVKSLVCAQVANEAARGFGFYEVENTDRNPFVQGRTWQVINTTTWKASDTLTIKNIASYGESRERYSFNLAGDFIPFPFVETDPGPQKGQGSQWSLTEELQIQGGTGDGRLSYQAGGYFERSEPVGGPLGQQQYTSIFSTCTNLYAFQCTPLTIPVPLPGGGTLTASAGSISIARNVYFFRNYGVYAQATYKLTDQLSVTAGIRNNWDREKEVSDNVRVTTSATGPTAYAGARSPFTCSRAVTPTPNPGLALTYGGQCTRVFATSSQKPTWLIDVDFKPNSDILIYAKWARGYRAGGINEANFGAETWQPERVDDYEAGIKTSFRGSVSGTFNLAGFWNEFRDQQSSVFIPQCTAQIPGCTNPAPTGINGIQNVGRSRLRGVEADGSLTLFKDLRFDFGYAYLDAVVTGGSVPFCDNTRFICSQASFLGKGARLPFAPKNRVTVTGTYTLPVDESIGIIAVGATFTHTDRQFATHGDDAAFAAGLIPYNPGIIPVTNLLNLNASWRSIAGGPVDVSLFATNVTNRKYRVGITNSLPTLGAEYLVLGEPRIYGVRLRLRFGD